MKPRTAEEVLEYCEEQKKQGPCWLGLVISGNDEADALVAFANIAMADLPRMAKEVLRLKEENAELWNARETVKGIIAHQTKKLLDLRALCGEAAEHVDCCGTDEDLEMIKRLKAAAEGKADDKETDRRDA